MVRNTTVMVVVVADVLLGYYRWWMIGPRCGQIHYLQVQCVKISRRDVRRPTVFVNGDSRSRTPV